MDNNLITLLLLTFIIHLIGTLSYSARIAGVRMGKIAISFSLFNLLVLFSRLSNSLQAPLLSKRIENNILNGIHSIPTIDFQLILLSASIATIIGGFLIPTFQRLFSKAIENFSIKRSIPRLLIHSFSKAGIIQFKQSIAIPASGNLSVSKLPKGLMSVLSINIIGTAIWTVAVLSSLYAGYLVPDLRVTAANLSAIVNGVATLVMFVVVDPFLSLLTDDAVSGKIPEVVFRKSVVWFVGSRLLGTIIAQFLLIPAASLIAFVARII